MCQLLLLLIQQDMDHLGRTWYYIILMVASFPVNVLPQLLHYTLQ